MTSPTDEEWPEFHRRIGDAQQVHAFGQISLTYNYLEDVCSTIFDECLPTDPAFSTRLFNELNNRNRIGLLKAFVEANEKESEPKAAIMHFINCYDICTENRNILMHSLLQSADADIVAFSKRRSKPPFRENVFRLPLADLRATADEMAAVLDYGFALNAWLFRRNTPNYAFRLPVPESTPTALQISAIPQVDWSQPLPPEPGPLPEKPQKPRSLMTYLPQEGQRGE